MCYIHALVVLFTECNTVSVIYSYIATSVSAINSFIVITDLLILSSGSPGDFIDIHCILSKKINAEILYIKKNGEKKRRK